ncbi:hypothetical protein ACFRFU_47260 [Streptomyces sp. NPDC056704]|uniref:hypothetical protein n=1 Tax=Streptomyces TaxID=1883 RepID=UPI0036975056
MKVIPSAASTALDMNPPVIHMLSAVVQTLGPWCTTALVIFLFAFTSIALPTVWSRHAYRRAAARRTLDTLVDVLRHIFRV